jgi:hypothetical protein
MTSRDSAAWKIDRTDAGPSASCSPADSADARRTAACTRACDGIPTEELEKGILHDLIAACIHLRDDERITEVLNRLVLSGCPSPRIVRRIEQLATGQETGEPAEPTATGAAPAPLAISVTKPAAAPSNADIAPTAATAAEKFRWGMRVRVSAKGSAEMPPTTASPVGVVIGFSRSYREVRIVRDGRTTPERFSMDYWEPDPDYRDANESIVAGVRTPAGRDGEPLPVKRSPALAWRRPPVSRETLHARRAVEPPDSSRYDRRDTNP